VARPEGGTSIVLLGYGNLGAFLFWAMLIGEGKEGEARKGKDCEAA